ncbi:sugar fermentation stimulation protein [Jannaschia pagri]|uniref:Sugar fermentation stimulation protein homolog n=1 Tax=Jannaschia pagri TaxID=2829797 RepID=A0ABQ4NQB4_9RHOB|nr:MULTISPECIES: DNA/RNA nuclease SfsA [unclassified Jannaschia]GIT92706.1 sugar fermentation stimulation protein [Jannaschia sp. AI_61]GIT96434.1 sugar fermentation stimulation protein [Jannaschia sp. AI_62]
MRFATPLIPATLVRRYKRFLADIVLDDGREVTAHCPNSGAMLGLKAPGSRIWVEPNDDPKKKLKYGWRLVELEGDHMAGIDTSVPNRVVGEALRARSVAELAGYGGVRAEVKYGENSRVDFLLTEEGLPDAYVEVKNVHLRREGDLAEFPDCVTTRGAKHLRELTEMVAQGHRAVMLYLVQRTDCARLAMAADLDPAYAEGLLAARAAGVEVLCLSTRITTEGVWADAPLPLASG